jgi:hypothetical protein
MDGRHDKISSNKDKEEGFLSYLAVVSSRRLDASNVRQFLIPMAHVAAAVAGSR